MRTYFSTPKGLAKAVDDVSFQLKKGETIGIVGESGSGKSVLSRTIIDILAKDGSVHIEGEILFAGKDLRKYTPAQMQDVRGKEISMIFQDPMSSLNPVMKIGKQISEVMVQRMGRTKAQANARALELLKIVGIPDPQRQMDRFPMHLSGGMRQRVAIAIALASEPKLLIADEPTTALDVTVQAQILDLLRDLCKETSMSMILITHDLGVVAKYTEKVVVMYAGKIAEYCATEELVGNSKHPYTAALLNSAPHLASPPHTRLEAIPGLPPNILNLPAGCRFSPRCARAIDACHTEMPKLSCDEDTPSHLFACWQPNISNEANSQ